MSEWYTPPQIASSRHVRLGKVLSWIHSGQLEAINHAENPAGRPRWRISIQALEAFDRARSSRQGIATAAPRRQRANSQEHVTEYF